MVSRSLCAGSIRDNSLDSLGFEVELVNKSDKDFVYDPESFGVRVGDEVYPQTISDAGGIVPAGKTQTAFFVVAGTATGGRNDLAVTNKFDIVMRQVTGERDLHRKVFRRMARAARTIPTAQRVGKSLRYRLRRAVHTEPVDSGF